MTVHTPVSVSLLVYAPVQTRGDAQCGPDIKFKPGRAQGRHSKRQLSLRIMSQSLFHKWHCT